MQFPTCASLSSRQSCFSNSDIGRMFSFDKPQLLHLPRWSRGFAWITPQGPIIKHTGDENHCLAVESHHDRVAEHRAHSTVHKSRPQQQDMGWSQGQLLFLLTKEESGSHLTSRGGHACRIAHSALEDHRGTFQQPSTPDYEILQDTVWRLKVIQCSPPSCGMQGERNDKDAWRISAFLTREGPHYMVPQCTTSPHLCSLLRTSGSEAAALPTPSVNVYQLFRNKQWGGAATFSQNWDKSQESHEWVSERPSERHSGWKSLTPSRTALRQSFRFTEPLPPPCLTHHSGTTGASPEARKGKWNPKSVTNASFDKDRPAPCYHRAPQAQGPPPAPAGPARPRPSPPASLGAAPRAPGSAAPAAPHIPAAAAPPSGAGAAGPLRPLPLTERPHPAKWNRKRRGAARPGPRARAPGGSGDGGGPGEQSRAGRAGPTTGAARRLSRARGTAGGIKSFIVRTEEEVVLPLITVDFKVLTLNKIQRSYLHYRI